MRQQYSCFKLDRHWSRIYLAVAAAATMETRLLLPVLSPSVVSYTYSIEGVHAHGAALIIHEHKVLLFSLLSERNVESAYVGKLSIRDICTSNNDCYLLPRPTRLRVVYRKKASAFAAEGEERNSKMTVRTRRVGRYIYSYRPIQRQHV